MFKIFLSILFLFSLSTQGFCVTNWNKAIPTIGDSKSIWPGQVTAQWSIVDTLLSNYRRGETLIFKNSTTLTVGLGEVVVSNSGASLRIFLQDAGNTDITTTNLDSGSSFSNSTIYYVYAAASSSTASSSTYYISLSSSAPTGPTYYYQLGSFITDASGNIQTITNGAPLNTTPNSNGTSFSAGTPYQNTSNKLLMVIWYGTGNTSGGWTEMNQEGDIGSTNSPSTRKGLCKFSLPSSSPGLGCGGSFMVPPGWWWQVTNSGGAENGTVGNIGTIETWNIN